MIVMVFQITDNSMFVQRIVQTDDKENIKSWLAVCEGGPQGTVKSIISMHDKGPIMRKALSWHYPKIGILFILSTVISHRCSLDSFCYITKEFDFSFNYKVTQCNRHVDPNLVTLPISERDIHVNSIRPGFPAVKFSVTSVICRSIYSLANLF